MELFGKFKVKQIKKKTAAVFFKGLKVGDEFTLSYNLSGNCTSAPTIDIISNDEVVHVNNALQLKNNLENFKLEQL